MTASPILFVDDDPDTCASMADLLADLGYSVDVASSGPDALRLVQQTPSYQLALLDYRMPDMDGLELFRHIHRARPEVVGVFVTGCAPGDVVDAALKAGVRRVLAKPVDFSALLPLLEEVLGRPSSPDHS